MISLDPERIMLLAIHLISYHDTTNLKPQARLSLDIRDSPRQWDFRLDPDFMILGSMPIKLHHSIKPCKCIFDQDCACFSREDYSEEEWKNIATVRKNHAGKNGPWEPPMTDLTKKVKSCLLSNILRQQWQLKAASNRGTIAQLGI